MNEVGLRSLQLEDDYRSDLGTLATRLWIPCLQVATRYDRAVGFFTSNGLQAISAGLGPFASSGGTMRLVASPLLSADDFEAIRRGYLARDDAVLAAVLREIAAMEADHPDAVKAWLATMVASEQLSVKLALPTAALPGIYHEKLAVFHDEHGDAVAVSGSANETVGGLMANFETVDVYRSWDATGNRVAKKQQHFESLWSGSVTGLAIMDFPEAAREQLVRLSAPLRHPSRQVPPPGTAEPPAPTEAGPRSLPELRFYQSEAVDAWLRSDGQGILAMATGSGKTITALAAIERLAGGSPRDLLPVILAPLTHLVDQWVDAARQAGFRPIACYGSSATWLNRAEAQIDYFTSGVATRTCLVSTHASSALAPLQSLLTRVPGSQLLLIADEVHHLGADGYTAGLAPHARYRLGLSATPERDDDDEGTQTLLDYFGGVVYRFDISAAITAGVLTPYDYRPIPVALSPDELVAYEEVCADLERVLEVPPTERDRHTVRRLMSRRADILNSASGKLAALRGQLGLEGRPYRLIYCANRTQLSATIDMMWDLHIGARQFTGEETAPERQALLRDFAAGRTPSIAAIRCLDEGVDVPVAREAHLLASSGNSRQFVQRRGRLLRLAPNKSSAILVDYVAVPDSTSDAGQRLLGREMRRVMEFAMSARNRDEAIASVWELLRRHGLLYLVGDHGRSRHPV